MSVTYPPVHNSPLLVHVLRHINPVDTLPFYFFKIHFNIILPPTTSLPVDVFPSVFQPKSCMNFLPLRASCPVHLIRSDSITWVTFYEEYQSWIFFNLVYSIPLEYTRLKFIASRASTIHKYESLRIKLMNFNANIHFKVTWNTWYNFGP
jgi:hypothetical protein